MDEAAGLAVGDRVGIEAHEYRKHPRRQYQTAYTAHGSATDIESKLARRLYPPGEPVVQSL
ncbi:hypothetical protein [Mycobacterium intracellulare]|uniref:hypothetical protein n=1 Tax=Mycobacterium intracellulare TaxID=1767 RepID=UPI001155DA58|nr:hypothetical protein [Mycobacterium intracellulare]MCA2231254.1 hypothetical protein [Mycobacterium intracellulare]